MTSIALALPVLLGWSWMNLLIPAEATARVPLVWGSGSLFGLLIIPQIMWLLNTLSIPLSFWAPASVTLVLIAVAFFLRPFGSQQREPARPEMRALNSMPFSHKVLFISLLMLVLLRMTSLGLEVVWRPLFPWDATMHWATKAKVWFEFNNMLPFVDNATWLHLDGENVYTDRHPDYPHTIPLLQVWMNLAIGRWDESLMNLPWLVCLTALGAAFYSQLRTVSVSPAISMAFTYLLLSMPLINTHVALAGYADLFLGASYCCALMALHNWITTKQRWQALLMIIFTMLCPMIKNEGYVWAATLVPAIILSRRSWRNIVKLGVIALAVGIAAALLLYQTTYSDQILGLITGFDRQALLGIIRSIWLHANWHLFGYLFLFSIAVGVMFPVNQNRAYRGIAIAIASALTLFLFLFLFTVFSQGASNYTGVGRLTIQLVPSLLYLTALICSDVLTRGSMRQLPTSTA